MVAEKLDRIDVVEAKLSRLIELKPTNAHALNALGYTLVDRTPRMAEGLALIERALVLAPDDPFILDSVGWANFRLGKLDEAEKYLRRAMEQRPDPEIAAHLGEVLWAKGDRARAQDVWQSQLKSTPDNAGAAGNRAPADALTSPNAARGAVRRSSRRSRSCVAGLRERAVRCRRRPIAFAGDAPFAIDGRLSARRGSDAVAIAFAWTHAPPRDELVVSTPLGQTVAELTGDASIRASSVRTADGRRDEAGDWATLTERVVGFPLPVDGAVAGGRKARRARTQRTPWKPTPRAAPACCGRTAARSSTRTPTTRRDGRRGCALVVPRPRGAHRHRSLARRVTVLAQRTASRRQWADAHADRSGAGEAQPVPARDRTARRRLPHARDRCSSRSTSATR